MPIYDMYPYSNLHELNLDWIIKEVEECKSDVADALSTMTSLFNAFTVDDDNHSITVNYDLYPSSVIQGIAYNAYFLLNGYDVPYNMGSSTEPIYFSGGKPAQCGSSLDADITGNAAGAASVVDSNGDPLTVGTNKKPVYINAGVPTICDNTLSNNISGKATYASRLIDSHDDPITVGTAVKPVYFSGGEPLECSLPYKEIKKVVFTSSSDPNDNPGWSSPYPGTLQGPSLVWLTEESPTVNPASFNSLNAIMLGGYISAGNSNETIDFLTAGTAAGGGVAICVGLTDEFDPDDLLGLGITLYYIDKF